ncbi:MAG: hypothetical protein KDK33_16670 [Leptospiraceae bacterium]|nr:hypothetical protein [Leptospiraceae bacterium]
MAARYGAEDAKLVITEMLKKASADLPGTILEGKMAPEMTDATASGVLLLRDKDGNLRVRRFGYDEGDGGERIDENGKTIRLADPSYSVNDSEGPTKVYFLQLARNNADSQHWFELHEIDQTTGVTTLSPRNASQNAADYFLKPERADGIDRKGLTINDFSQADLEQIIAYEKTGDGIKPGLLDRNTNHERTRAHDAGYRTHSPANYHDPQANPRGKFTNMNDYKKDLDPKVTANEKPYHETAPVLFVPGWGSYTPGTAKVNELIEINNCVENDRTGEKRGNCK